MFLGDTSATLGTDGITLPKQKVWFQISSRELACPTLGKGTSSTQKCRLGCEMLVPRRVSKRPPELAQGTSMSLASSSSFLAAWCSAFESKGWKFKNYVLPVLQNPTSFMLFTHGGMLSISWRFTRFTALVFPKGFFANFANHITAGGKISWSSCLQTGFLRGGGWWFP